MHAHPFTVCVLNISMCKYEFVSVFVWLLLGKQFFFSSHVKDVFFLLLYGHNVME